jgi:DNA-binding NtrC family response regulator
MEYLPICVGLRSLPTLFYSLEGASIQVKLLRFLHEQRIQRFGGRQEIQIETRVIAAPNADPEQARAEETFRQDLYFRLAVGVITLAPLRERSEDLNLLAWEFLQRFAVQAGKSNLTFSPKPCGRLTATLGRETFPNCRIA